MSPDLNPIVHLWRVLKRKVEENKPLNIAKLKKAIQDEWTSISIAACAHLVDYTPRRLDAVISSKGSHTKYLEKSYFLQGCTYFCNMYNLLFCSYFPKFSSLCIVINYIDRLYLIK